MLDPDSGGEKEYGSGSLTLVGCDARMCVCVQGENRYRGVLGTGLTVVREGGGISALYRGLVPSLIGAAPNAGTVPVHSGGTAVREFLLVIFSPSPLMLRML